MSEANGYAIGGRYIGEGLEQLGYALQGFAQTMAQVRGPVAAAPAPAPAPRVADVVDELEDVVTSLAGAIELLKRIAESDDSKLAARAHRMLAAAQAQPPPKPRAQSARKSLPAPPARKETPPMPKPEESALEIIARAEATAGLHARPDLTIEARAQRVQAHVESLQPKPVTDPRFARMDAVIAGRGPVYSGRGALRTLTKAEAQRELGRRAG